MRKGKLLIFKGMTFGLGGWDILVFGIRQRGTTDAKEEMLAILFKCVLLGKDARRPSREGRLNFL